MSEGSRLGRVDDLRAAAAMAVFVDHVAVTWLASQGDSEGTYAGYLGRLGVAVFFVISGLVIYRPFVAVDGPRTRVDLWGYAVRRLVRIVPAYWVALVFFTAVKPWLQGFTFSPATATFAAFGQIYTSRTYFSGLTVAWTLDIEVCFYAAVPLIAIAVGALSRTGRGRRLELWVLLALAGGSVLVRVISPNGVIGGTILGYFGWFVIGMLLARAIESPRPQRRRIWGHPAAWWAIGSAGFALLGAHLSDSPANQGSTLLYVALGLLAAIFVLPALSRPTERATAVGKWLGDRSYGIYLWHLPIVRWLADKNLYLPQYIAFSVCLTLLAANLSYHLLERPLMRRATALRRSSAAARPASDTDLQLGSPTTTF